MSLCSVIMPVYNVEAYVREAIESALSQTYSSTEVIVVDDGSTDSTPAVLDSFDGRIVRIHQQNRGLAAARNRALDAASGSYIALLDGDDVWLPERLERMIAFLEAHRECGFATSDAYFIGYDGTRTMTRYYEELRPGFQSSDQLRWILRYNFVFGMAVIRRGLFERHGTFDETLRTSEDYDLWLRFISRGERVGLVNEPLAYYRLRRGSLFDDRELVMRDTLAVVERAVDAVDTTAVPRVGEVLYERGLQSLSRNDLTRASKFLRLAACDRSLARSQRVRARVGQHFPALASRWVARKRRRALRPVS